MPLLEGHLQTSVERLGFLIHVQAPVVRCRAKKYVFSHKATLLTTEANVKLLQWIRSVRLHRAQGGFVASDRCGWLPGYSATRLGMMAKAIREYLR